MKRFLIDAEEGSIAGADIHDDLVSGWIVQITDTWFGYTGAVSGTTKAEAIGNVAEWINNRLANITKQSVDSAAEIQTL